MYCGMLLECPELQMLPRATARLRFWGHWHTIEPGLELCEVDRDVVAKLAFR